MWSNAIVTVKKKRTLFKASLTRSGRMVEEKCVDAAATGLSNAKAGEKSGSKNWAGLKFDIESRTALLTTAVEHRKQRANSENLRPERRKVRTIENMYTVHVFELGLVAFHCTCANTKTNVESNTADRFVTAGTRVGQCANRVGLFFPFGTI